MSDNLSSKFSQNIFFYARDIRSINKRSVNLYKFDSSIIFMFICHLINWLNKAFAEIF